MISNKGLDGMIMSFDIYENYRDKVKKLFMAKRQARLAQMKWEASLDRKKVMGKSASIT